jgi:3-methyladenine DNA glycosylase AlkC
MAEQLKTFFSPALVRRLAESIQRVHPAFDSKAFVRSATKGLDDLELLDRGKLIARALAGHLPANYADAIAILLRSLGPEHESDELIGAGMAPFFYYPHTVFVAEHGLEHFELSMKAQYELTRRFSAEGSIRSFIAHDPERTLAQLKAWTHDPNAHVRRLVSEGTRLRLPWAMRVTWLDRNPDRVIELLELLKGDPATLVRRSVANNLNDLGKVHPALLAEVCERWLADATPDRRALVEHALRSAVKRGDDRALRLLGYGGKPSVSVDNVRFTPKRISIGGRVTMTFDVRSTARVEQELLVDVAVHFVKASGKPSRKVFKVKRVTLAARDQTELRMTISLAVHTTRKPQPGKHSVEVVINGAVLPAGVFEVTKAKAQKRESRRR